MQIIQTLLFCFALVSAISSKEIIKSRFEDGPLGVEVLNTHKSLQYIGLVGGRQFYYDDVVKVTMVESNVYCQQLGLGLYPASFSTVEEMEFVWERVPSERLWVYSSMFQITWRYWSGQTIPGVIAIANNPEFSVGLTFDGDNYPPKLLQTLTSQLYYPMCVLQN